MKWLQQEVLKLARQELLNDLQPAEEGDWPIDATTDRPREFDRSLFGDPNEGKNQRAAVMTNIGTG